jgi:hypothetical protein
VYRLFLVHFGDSLFFPHASMGVLWNFVLTSLLLTNAVCILHEKRFLRPRTC